MSLVLSALPLKISLGYPLAVKCMPLRGTLNVHFILLLSCNQSYTVSLIELEKELHPCTKMAPFLYRRSLVLLQIVRYRVFFFYFVSVCILFLCTSPTKHKPIQSYTNCSKWQWKHTPSKPQANIPAKIAGEADYWTGCSLYQTVVA